MRASATRHAVHLLAIAVTVALAFGPSLGNDFALDDQGLLLDNHAVQGMTLDHLRRIIATPSNGVEYLPLRDLSLLADHAVWGLNPFGYHLSNLIWYTLACAALYALLLEILGALGAAAPTAVLAGVLIFAVHPLHVEVAAGISQRKDILVTLFVCLSSLAYLAARRTGRPALYLAALAAAACALLSKSTAVVLPVLIALLEWTVPEPDGTKRGAAWRRLWPFFVLTLLLTLVNYQIMAAGGFFASAPVGGMAERLHFMMTALLIYTSLLLVPRQLSIWHPLPLHLAHPLLWTAAGLALALALPAAVFALRRRAPVWALSVGWYAVALAPTLFFATSMLTVAYRYLFLPGVAAALIVAHLIGRLTANRGPATRTVVVLGLLCPLLIWTLQSHRLTRTWKDNLTLYGDALRLHPDSVELINLVGSFHFDRGRYEEAFRYFRLGKELAPYGPELEFYEALYAHLNGQERQSLEKLRAITATMGMDIVNVRCLEGRVLETLGDAAAARASYRRAVAAPLSLNGPCAAQDAHARLDRLGGG